MHVFIINQSEIINLKYIIKLRMIIYLSDIMSLIKIFCLSEINYFSNIARNQRTHDGNNFRNENGKFKKVKKTQNKALKKE